MSNQLNQWKVETGSTVILAEDSTGRIIVSGDFGPGINFLIERYVSQGAVSTAVYKDLQLESLNAGGKWSVYFEPKFTQAGSDQNKRPIYVDARISDRINAVIAGANYLQSNRGLDDYAVRVSIDPRSGTYSFLRGYPGT